MTRRRRGQLRRLPPGHRVKRREHWKRTHRPAKLWEKRTVVR